MVSGSRGKPGGTVGIKLVLSFPIKCIYKSDEERRYDPWLRNGRMISDERVGGVAGNTTNP